MRFIRFDYYAFSAWKPDLYPYTFWFTITLYYKSGSGIEMDAGIDRMMNYEIKSPRR